MHYLTFHYVCILVALILAILAALNVPSRFGLIAAALAFFFASCLISGCSTYEPAKLAATPAGSAVIARTADKVIQKQLDAAATKIDTGNPYLHSIADAIRSNPDGIIDPANVQRLVANFGDPNNKAKFKTLAWDIWKIAKDAAIQFGTANAAELIAKGLQDGATNGR